jgi:hypothetical protein
MNIKLIGLNLVMGVGFATLVAAPTMAQAVNNADALKDFKTESTDPFSNRGGDNYGSMFDLMHRIMQGSPDSEAFKAQQQENLDSAAANFKELQRQRLLQQNASGQQANTPSPTTPVVTP